MHPSLDPFVGPIELVHGFLDADGQGTAMTSGAIMPSDSSGRTGCVVDGGGNIPTAAACAEVAGTATTDAFSISDL